jgi:uncharacterized protein (DUF2141 family)
MYPLLLLHLLFSLHTAVSNDGVETEVLIRNIKSPQGTFVISLYDDSAAFPKVNKELLTETVTVKDTLPHLIRIKVPKEGWYAIAMYQDVDGNGKIKQDKVSIPQEPYAFSNNIHPKVAAPTFTLCKYYIAKQKSVPAEIRLIQPKFGGKL